MFKLETAGLTYEAAAGRPGVERLTLFRDNDEDVRLERWAPAATIILDLPGGAELLVLDGAFDQGGERFEPLSWLRLPMASVLQAAVGQQGCRIWIKTGHHRRIRGGTVERG